jgi:hypothetical protein
MAFTLEKIVPWGRSFEEYISMFRLTSGDLRKKILGCGDGPASFNSRMNKAGRPVISVDPIYQFAADEIAGRIAETYKEILGQLEKSQEDYLWSAMESPEKLGQIRMAAMREFLADFALGKAAGRYVPGELPALPFAENQFDLALCSHLLFLYSEQLTLEFHKQAISELCRVAKEVRIFPLVTLAGNKSIYIRDIESHFKKHGHALSIETVPYEFQRGGNEMMKINKIL